MNDEDKLEVFYTAVSEMVRTKPEKEWDALLTVMARKMGVKWTPAVGAAVEILCGGDVIVVDDESP